MRITTASMAAVLGLLLAPTAFAQEEKPKPADATVKKAVILNPNLATAEKLAELPHMTEAVAAGILEKRPFLGMDKLHTLIGEKLTEEQRDELYPKLFIPINLNAAKREEILLIPGVGRRMAHEFEEYRPYTNIGQFRREIGKYVDKTEVARLELFVFIPRDLNTATEEQFKSIPGVGNRMVHEFIEYRPYTNIEQFRREIGKYVDKKEVARLERYVFIK